MRPARAGLAARLGLCLAVATAVVLLVGCGDSDTDEYATEITEVMGPLSDETQRLSDELTTAGSQREAVGLLDEAEGTLDQAAADLEAIEPPDDYVDLHGRLVDLQEGFAGATGDFGDAVRGGDARSAAGEYQQEALDFRERLEQLRSDYADEGIEFE